MSHPTRDDGWRSATEAHHLGDVDGFLTADEVRHYNRFLGTGGYVLLAPRESGSFQWSATVIHPETPPAERDRLMRELAGYKAAIEPGVTRTGTGPDACSASQALAVSPSFCWDVCGYYRRLGIPWRATRKQLMEAGMRLGITLGRGDSRAAYALSQLLNREIRREYDRMPLGGYFLRDAYVQELLKKEAMRIASELYAEDGEEVSVEDILAGMGFDIGQGGAAAGEQPEAPRPLPRAGDLAGAWRSQWSWYRLTGDADVTWRAGILESWQLMLVRAFAERGMTEPFSVGLYSGEGIHVRHGSSPGSLIIFLGRDEPSHQLARDAVEQAQLASQP